MWKWNHTSSFLPEWLWELGEKSDLLFPECPKQHPATLAEAEAQSDAA